MKPTLLETLMKPGAISTRFQPIVVAGEEGKIHAVECLTRGPQGTLFESPAVLFEYVRRKRAEVPVERECIRVALETLKTLPCSVAATLNVHASTLARDSEFVRDLARRSAMTGVGLDRIIIEIVEHSPAWNQPAFLGALQSLREIGVRIALDDIGLGNSNYRMILDARPDYFKIDAYICRNASADHARLTIIKSIVQMAIELGGKVVAEGIENRSDYEVLVSSGVHFIQGYLFHRPLKIDELARVLPEDGSHFPVRDLLAHQMQENSAELARNNV
jgi:EAL domain-containing protein (putative c-di-GMP-specific phosphodiesterase class I)